MTARHLIGVNLRMHDVSHERNNIDHKVRVAAWNVEQFGKVLRALQNKAEDGVPLLEKTFASFMVGEGYGPHSASTMEVVFAGPPRCASHGRIHQHIRPPGAASDRGDAGRGA